MTQKCKITFGNVSHNDVCERVFQSRNQALIWLNHELVRQCRCPTVHELYFRLESYYSDHPDIGGVLPF